MREGEPGAVASAPVEEQPTKAAKLQIILLPESGSEGSDGSQDSPHGTISVSWTWLRRAIHASRAGQGRH